MAKFCSECANPIIDDNVQFCGKCGAKIPISDPFPPHKDKHHRLPHDIPPKKPPTYEEAPTWTTSDLEPSSEPPVESPIEPPPDTTQPPPTPTPPPRYSGAQILVMIIITIILSVFIAAFVFNLGSISGSTGSSGCPAGYSTSINNAYKCCPAGYPYSDNNGVCHMQPSSSNTVAAQQGPGLTPARDLTGTWSGTYNVKENVANPYYPSGSTGKAFMTFKQTGNKIEGSYRATLGSGEEINYITGTVSSTRIDFTDGFRRFSGSFTSLTTNLLNINVESCSFNQNCVDPKKAGTCSGGRCYVSEPGIKGTITLTRDR